MSTALEILISARDITGGAFGTALKGVDGLSNAVFSLKGMMAGLGVGIVADQLWDAGLQSERLSATFKAIQGDAVKGASELEFLRQTADDLGVEFWNVAGSYKGILAASKETDLEGQKTRDIFKGITETGVALRMTNDEITGSLRAVEQMMSKSKVQAEELRGQLGERLSGAFNIAAKSMGLSTQQLDKMMERGELMASDLLPRLAKALHEKYGKAAAEASDSATASMARFKTEWMDMKVGLAESGFMDVAVDVLGDLTDELKEAGEWVADNGEEVEDFFEGMGIFIKAVGTAAVYAVEKGGDLIQWLSDISAVTGLASTGAVSWSDLINSPEDLDKLVKQYDASPMLMQLETQQEKIESAIKIFKRGVKDASEGSWMKMNLAKQLAAEIKKLDTVKEQIEKLQKESKQVPALEKSFEVDEGVVEKAKIVMAGLSDEAIKAQMKYDQFLLKSMDKTTEAYQTAYLSAELEKWSKVKGITQEQLSGVQGIILDSFKGVGDAAAVQYDQFVLQSMDKTTAEYQEAYLSAEMEKWSKVKGITQEQLDEINFIILDNQEEIQPNNSDNGGFSSEIEKFKKLKELYKEGLVSKEELEEAKKRINEAFFVGVKENFTQSVQTEIGGVFTDVLKEDLDSATAYFEKFTDSLQSIWGAGMAQMIMSPAAWSVGGFAGMGVAGVALAGAGKYFGDRSKKKAEEAERARIRAQLTDQVEDSIAKLELSDVNYEIYQLNESFEEMVTQATRARMPLDDIIKLRQLETEEIVKQAREGYDNLNNSIDDWVQGKQRQDWGVSDWQSEYGNLSDSIMALDQDSNTYQDDSLELLTEQFEILQQIHSIQEDQLRSLQSTDESLTSQMWSLQHSDGMPTSSTEYQNQYDELYQAALAVDANGMHDTQAIADFQGFANDYVDVMSTLGYDFNDLVSNVTDDLSDVQEGVQSEMEILTAALSMNTGAVDGNTLAIIGQLAGLQDVIQDIADDEERDAYVEAIPRPEMITRADTGQYGFGGLNVGFGGLDWAQGVGDGSITGTTYGQYEQELIGWHDYEKMLDGWYAEAESSLDDSTKATVNEWRSWLDSMPWDMMENDYLDNGGQWKTQQGWLDFMGEFNGWAQQSLSLPDLPMFEYGGWTNQPSIFGEKGPEWAIPAVGNPRNDDFKKSVGLTDVVETVRQEIRSLQGSGGGGAPIHIHVHVDGREIADVIVDQSRIHPELKEVLQQ